MDPEERGNSLKVGAFLALGLAAVAGTVVYFGRFGEAVRPTYQIRVEYENASGLLRGASVLLAGAKVGTVVTAPEILPDLRGVFVTLKIFSDVKVPTDSVFSIGSSGLLGDRFVQIVPGAGALDSPPIEPGATVQGKGESGGFAELADGAGDLLAELRTAVRNIDAVARKLDTEIFSAESVAELKRTLENLEKTSASFAEASGKLEGVLEKAGAAAEAGESALSTAKSAGDELRKALADLRALLQQARQGRGVLALLLNDREMADNLRALVANMRRHGILFYKDAAQQPRR